MAKIYGNTTATTMSVDALKKKLEESGIGGSGGGLSKDEVVDLINDSHENAVFPSINRRAERDLSNVDDEVFLAKINAVLSNGDEVSY